MTTPLKITAHMLSGVAFTPQEGIALDGPLLWACVLERHGDAALARSPSAAEIEAEVERPDPDMPIATYAGPDGGWCYCASHADLVGHVGTEVVHWHKRFDDALAGDLLDRGALDMGRKSRVNTGSGEFKAYRVPLYLGLVDRLVWYAVGDGERVRSLLERHIQHLGKKHDRGHGAVAAWDVEDWIAWPIAGCGKRRVCRPAAARRMVPGMAW